MGRPQANHVRVDPTNPEAAGMCDLCGRWFQLRTLRRQSVWVGNMIYTFNSLRCVECWDVPNEQLRTIILPPDPPPLLNSRVPNFAFEEYTNRILQQRINMAKNWEAGPQRIRVLQRSQIPRILQLQTSS